MMEIFFKENQQTLTENKEVVWMTFLLQYEKVQDKWKKNCDKTQVK